MLDGNISKRIDIKPENFHLFPLFEKNESVSPPDNVNKGDETHTAADQRHCFTITGTQLMLRLKPRSNRSAFPYLEVDAPSQPPKS